MPNLSEFVAEKSGVEKPGPIQKDVILHKILKELCSFPIFAENYLFKGGGGLIKCFFGRCRFSVGKPNVRLEKQTYITS